MFATTSDRNPVQFYKVYADKRPEGFSRPDDPFYIAPRTTANLQQHHQWFFRQCVGIKKLGSLLKTMATSAGLVDKNISNHSARKHLVQKLRDENVPPTDIMQITGHRNVQSIINYSSISEEKQKMCSRLLSSTRSGCPTATASCTTADSIQPAATKTSSDGTSCAVASDMPHPPLTPASVSMSSQNTLNSVFPGAVFHVQNFNVFNNQKN